MKKLMTIVVSALFAAVAFTCSAESSIVDITADVRAKGLVPKIKLESGAQHSSLGVNNLFDGNKVVAGRFLAEKAPVSVSYELPSGYGKVFLTAYSFHQLVADYNYSRSPMAWTLSAWDETAGGWVAIDDRTFAPNDCPWTLRGNDDREGNADLKDVKVTWAIASDKNVMASKFKIEFTANNGNTEQYSIGLGDMDLVGLKEILKVVMPDQKFDGLKPVVPTAPVVTDLRNGKTLEPDADYTYAFAGDFDRLGTCTCTVTGMGEYAGCTSTVEFKIVSAYGSGTIYYAKPDGAAGAACTMREPGSISAALALAMAKSGNAVYLADGDYDVSKIATTEKAGYTFNLLNNVRICGMSGDRTKVRLIGGGDENKRACFYSGSASSVRNLTVTNFSATVGGCGLYVGAANTVVSNCLFVGLKSTAQGCAFFQNYNLQLTVYDCRVENCSSTANHVGNYAYGNKTTMYDTEFVNCEMTGEKTGGCVFDGLYIRCLFENIRASGTNPGSSVGKARYSDCVIKDCTIGSQVFGSYQQPATIERCQIIGCKNVGYMDTFSQCILSNNIEALSVNKSTFRNCLIINNSISSGSLVAQGSVLENCTFVGNSGGSLFAGSGTTKPGMHPLNCVFVENTSVLLGSTYNAWVTLDHCIFTEGAEKSATHSQWVAVTNCIFLANPVDCGKSEFEQMRFVGANDKGLPYYSLQRKSPAVDRGTNLTYTVESVDLAGNPRVVTKGESLAENPNAIVDIGCYENQGRAPGLMLLFW